MAGICSECARHDDELFVLTTTRAAAAYSRQAGPARLAGVRSDEIQNRFDVASTGCRVGVHKPVQSKFQIVQNSRDGHARANEHPVAAMNFGVSMEARQERPIEQNRCRRGHLDSLALLRGGTGILRSSEKMHDLVEKMRTLIGSKKKLRMGRSFQNNHQLGFGSTIVTLGDTR